MADNNFNNIINDNNPDRGDNFVSENSDNSEFDFSSDDWGDLDNEIFTPSEVVTHSNSLENIYHLEGYGVIYDLDDYLFSGNGIIELLEHSKSQEQFNYILGMSKEAGHDDDLLSYLMSKNYDVANYVSIDVGYQIFKFKKLIDYLLSNANSDEVKSLLSKVAYIDEDIAKILVSRDDRLEIIAANFHLKDIFVTRKLIEYFKENPNEVDFDALGLCELDTETIEGFLELGYEIKNDSPYVVLQNNEIMRKAFINLIGVDSFNNLSNLEEEFNSIPGAYGRLYKSNSKEIFSNGFAEVFGKSAFEQMIKYIVLSDYDIDFSLIKGNSLIAVKRIYDALKERDTFDVQLFVKIVCKFNLNPSIFISVNETFFEQNKDKLRIYFEYKGIQIKDLSDFLNIERVLYNYQIDKIKSCDNVIDIKTVICSILTNQTYFETKKGLSEMGTRLKLSVLKNSIKNERVSKLLDSYIILCDFLSQIDQMSDLKELKDLAVLLNEQWLNNGINYKWLNLNRKLMEFYTFEANEKMTNFNDYSTEKFYDASDFSFQDGTSVYGKRVPVSHIKSGEEFNSFIHVLNAYANAGTIGTVESIRSSKFIGKAYICLTGISDEYSRICVNRDSRGSIKVLYSRIPEGDLFCAANRDTGIDACSNSKNISTRLPANMFPFRRLVRNTETHGSETYNEYDVFRDNMVPSGIAFMGDNPNEDEINVAAYLGVPLVKIDDLQYSFRKDAHSLSISGLSYDESFYNIKEHEYENQEITVSSNDKYDVVINAIKEKIQNQQKRTMSIDAFSKKDEIGYEEYFVMYNGEMYSATPVYEYVDSKRRNIEAAYYEKSLIKSKLYEFLDIKPRTTFVSCKYPNGNEIMSVINNTNESRLIDKYIDYLVDVPDSKIDFSELSSYNINSIDELRLLNRVNSLNDDVYMTLFESLIKINNYVEPSIMISRILLKKEQLNLMLSKYNELFNQSQVSTNSETLDRFNPNSIPESSYTEEGYKKI